MAWVGVKRNIHKCLIRDLSYDKKDFILFISYFSFRSFLSFSWKLSLVIIMPTRLKDRGSQIIKKMFISKSESIPEIDKKKIKRLLHV